MPHKKQETIKCREFVLEGKKTLILLDKELEHKISSVYTKDELIELLYRQTKNNDSANGEESGLSGGPR